MAEKISRQKQVFLNWINFKVSTRDDATAVQDLMTDLKDGLVLYVLLEELSGQSLAAVGKMKAGRLRIQHVDNMIIVFKYLPSCVKMVGIGPQDIVDSTNEALVMGMVWSIIVYFTVRVCVCARACAWYLKPPIRTRAHTQTHTRAHTHTHTHTTHTINPRL